MRKIYLLLSMLVIAGWAQGQTCTNPISAFPHIQDFETSTAGAPGVLPTGWTTAPATGFRWEIEDGPTSSSNTGPNADHTTGAAGGKYIYTEASSGALGAVADVTSPCFNISALTSPGFDFWYHFYGTAIGSMNIQVSSNNGTTWTTISTITGQQQPNQSDPWLKRTVSLAGYTGNIQIRFSGTRGSSFEGDMSIDDFKLYNIPAIDVELIALTLPASGCSLTSTETICVTVKNNGNSPQTGFPVSYQIGSNPAVTENFTPTLAPGASAQYCFTTKANFSTANAYNVTGTTMLTGDGDATNNSKSGTVTSIPNVASFPYFQNFENGAGGWVAGGTASTWALGTPAGTTINSAASGTNAWATNLTGSYNNNEKSQVASPCFNMSTLTQPLISMKIWWNSEPSYDGAVLQSSINGGTTWQNVGMMGDPNNWYNDNSINGGPGDQPGTSAQGWTGRTGGTISGSGGWVTAKHALTGLGGQSSVLLRIAFGSEGSVVDDGFAFDDISIFEAPANDVGIMALTSPSLSGCGFSATEQVCITIKNFGSAATTSFPVSYQIGSNTAVTQNVTTPIAPGATSTFCFTTTANLSAGGNYNFTFTTALPGDGDPSNNTLTATVTNPLINSFPHIQNFESSTAGAPGVLPTGWTITPTTGYRWEIEDGPTSSSNTGPNSDHTTGAAGGKYVYTEASSGSTGNTAELITPCIDLSGLTTPGFDFWYHMYGTSIGALDVEVSSNGGTTWTNLTTITGQQQTAQTDPWVKRTVSLAGYTGVVRIRFKGTKSTSFEGDIAIDDVKFYNIPSTDAEVISITLPNSGCSLTATENVCMNIKNNGNAAISNFPVNYTINGAGLVTETANITIAPGATMQYCFTTKANLTTANTYTIVVTSALTGDGDPSNNSKTGTVTSIPNVSSFPYSENFENGPGGWVSGGTNSTWGHGTPASSTINSAASGTKAWVTNLTGSYNNSESSYVMGPCFNFSAIPDPDFEMKIWWDSENSYDGAVLQSSIDGGTTWVNVGSMSSTNATNWYNDASINGNPGGQQEGWTGSPGSAGWVTAKHKLTGLGGQSSVLLRIAFGSETSVVDEGFAFDDVRIGDNSGNLAIVSFTPLTKVCGFNSTEPINVILENLGSIPASGGITLSYTVNGGPAVTETFTGTLQPNAQTPFTFATPANLSAPGTYTIVVTISGPNDPELANNTITYTITNASFAGLPPTFDFETATSGIAAMRTIAGPKATITEGAGASFGGGSTKGMIMSGVTNPNWQIPAGTTSPWTVNPEHLAGAYICFSPAGGSATDSLWLMFDLKQLYKTANANTNFRVTVDGQQVGPTYRPPFNPANPATPIVWQKIKIDLTAHKNKSNIQIGLESSVAEPYANGNGPANLIDNVVIARRINSTKDNYLNAQLNVFPNPSKGTFRVELPTGKTYELEVTDITGKTIKTQKATGGESQLNLNVPMGVYLLKVASRDGIAVRKLIVE